MVTVVPEVWLTTALRRTGTKVSETTWPVRPRACEAVGILVCVAVLRGVHLDRPPKAALLSVLMPALMVTHLPQASLCR